MRKIILIAAAALSLGACAFDQASVGGIPASPAPLATTTADKVALDTAWKTFDLALDAIKLLQSFGKLPKGSPKAVAVADAIHKVQGALTAAESFEAAGSTTDAIAALQQAQAGIGQIQALIK